MIIHLDKRITRIHRNKRYIFTGMDDKYLCMQLKNEKFLLSLDDKDMFYYWNDGNTFIYLYRFDGHFWDYSSDRNHGNNELKDIYNSIVNKWL